MNFLFFHMSRCVLISPLCTEHQNVRPREQLVSNNQNQTISFFFSLLRIGQTQMSAHWPPPETCGVPLSKFHNLSNETLLKCVVIKPESQRQSMKSVSEQWLQSFRNTWQDSNESSNVLTDHMLSFHTIRYYIMHEEHMSILVWLLTMPKSPAKSLEAMNNRYVLQK